MAGTSAAAQAANEAALAKATANLNMLAVAVAKDSPKVLEGIAIKLVNEIKRKLSQPGSGAIYRRGGVTHQASAPGEPPAVDRGRLRASYTWQAGGEGKGSYVDIGTNTVYAPMLEYGTSRMAPRPHFRPAIEAERQRIREQIVQSVLATERAAIAKMLR